MARMSTLGLTQGQAAGAGDDQTCHRRHREARPPTRKV